MLQVNNLKNNQNISTDVVYTFGGQAISMLVAILSMPFLIRILGNDRIGVLSIIWVLIGYLTILDLGMGPAVTQMVSASFKSGDYKKAPVIFWNALLIQLIFGFLGGIALFLFTPSIVTDILRIPRYLHEEATYSLIIASLAFPVVLVSSSVTGFIQSLRRFDVLASVQIFSGISQFILPLIFVMFWKNLPIAVFAILTVRFLSTGYLLFFSIKTFPDLRKKWQIAWPVIKKLFGFGGWITVSSIVSPLLVYADRFFLGHILTIAMVAFYAVPVDVVIRLLIIPRSLTSVLFPVFSGIDLKKETERINELFFRSIKYILSIFGILIVLLFTFARDILMLWLGPEYAANSTVALQIVLIGILSCSISMIPYNMLQAVGRADITAKIHLAELLIFVGLSYFLISYYGLIGAAVAWCVRLVIETGILLIFSHKIAGIRIKYISKRAIINIMVMLLSMGFAGKYLTMISTTLMQRAFSGVLLALVGSIVLWTMIFNQTDRGMFLNLLKRRES